MMKNRVLIWVAIIMTLMVAVLLSHNIALYKANKSIKPDTVLLSDTVITIDTFCITKEKPIPKYIEVLKIDTVYDVNGNEIELKFENKLFQDTLICENDTAELKIHTTGIKSSIDSISLKLRRQQTVVNNTIEITKYIEKPKKRIHIGPQITGGYDVINRNWGVMVGIGVSIDLN